MKYNRTIYPCYISTAVYVRINIIYIWLECAVKLYVRINIIYNWLECAVKPNFAYIHDMIINNLQILIMII